MLDLVSTLEGGWRLLSESTDDDDDDAKLRIRSLPDRKRIYFQRRPLRTIGSSW
jgi:hypothetical protein